MVDTGPNTGIRIVETGLKDSISGWNRIKSRDFLETYPQFKNYPLRVFSTNTRDTMIWDCPDDDVHKSDIESLNEALENAKNESLRKQLEDMIHNLQSGQVSCQTVKDGFATFSDCSHIDKATPKAATESEVVEESKNEEGAEVEEPEEEEEEETPEEEIQARDVGGDGSAAEVPSTPTPSAPPPVPESLPQPPPPPPFVTSGQGV